MSTIDLTKQEAWKILDALSYVHWNDKSLSKPDRDYIHGLYQSLDNSSARLATA